MNVQKLKLMAYNKEALVIRINVCYLLFLNCSMGNVESTLCSSDEDVAPGSGSKLSVRNFSRLFL